MSNVIKNEFNKIEIPKDLHSRVLQGIDVAKEEMELIKQEQKVKQKWSRLKKVGLISGAAIIAIAILFASAINNPAMADMLTKIPFFNTIIHSKTVNKEYPPLDLNSALSHKLWVAGYLDSGVSITPYKPEAKVYFVGSKQEYNKKKGQLKSYVVGLLQSYGLDDYKVTTIWDKQTYEQTVNYKKEHPNDVYYHVFHQLWSKGYQIEGVRDEKAAKLVKITVQADEENRLTAIKDEAMKILRSMHLADYKVDVVSVKTNKSLEDKWFDDIIPDIAIGLPYKAEYKVKNVGIKYTKDLVTIFVETNLNGNAGTMGKEIEKAVEDFMDSKRISNYIEHQPYQVIVSDKNNKKIN